MLLLLAVVALLALQAGDALALDTANWMRDMWPVISPLSVLDLSLPGTHDTLTADLSDTIADNANDLPPDVADVLHDLVPRELIGSFIRKQAQTQGLTVTEQLDAGVRFLDFRMTYTRGPDSVLGKHDWYGLHLVETNQRAVAYFREIQEWLIAHPYEFVVLPLTKHGTFCENGTAQFPGTTPAVRQALWKDIEGIFGEMLVDHTRVRVNETSLADMLKLKGRVVVYAGDYRQFTNNSTRALDACLIYNDLQGDVENEEQSVASQLQTFENALQTRAKLKRENRFFLMSLATSGGNNLVFAIELVFQPFDHSAIRRKCAALFHMPNVTDWCPLSLLEMSQTAEYYNQRVLHEAVTRGFAFPNAIYTDAIDHNGTIRVGTDTSYGDGQSRKTARYAYVASVLKSTLNLECKRRPVSACAPLDKQLTSMIAANPVTTWNDPAQARLVNWPVLPKRTP